MKRLLPNVIFGATSVEIIIIIAKAQMWNFQIKNLKNIDALPQYGVVEGEDVIRSIIKIQDVSECEWMSFSGLCFLFAWLRYGSYSNDQSPHIIS